MAYLKTCFPGGAQTSNWVQFFELYLRCQGSPPCVDGPGSARDVGRAHTQNWGTLLLPADLTPCFPAAGGAPSLPPIFSWTNCIFPLLLQIVASPRTHIWSISLFQIPPHPELACLGILQCLQEVAYYIWSCVHSFL